ncbi:MAG: alpha/beta fold hydrolase [Armatimonadetes bacterium]|nr:alpha/beta fold hydrolase [Armatimonadota bacterium]
MAKEDFPGASRGFDTTVKGAPSPEAVGETWKSVTAKLGPFKRQVGVRTEKSGLYDIAYVPCEFEKSAIEIKVVFNSQKRIIGFWFLPARASTEYNPPFYVKRSSFQEKPMTVGGGEWALPGTLAIPAGKGPFPAVVLVHGSGPNDRDETIGPNKPFRDLAWGLASQGVAVLRYEKRTKEHGQKLAAIKETITVKEETIDDALAAVALLRKTGDIDPSRITVLGHSLGGMVIPRIGALDTTISGFVVLAGSTRPLEDITLAQVLYLASLQGSLTDADNKGIETLRKQVAMVKSPRLSLSVPPTELPFGIPAKYWLDLRGYFPPDVAKNLKHPMLILQGERDYQVTMEDFQGWKGSLSTRKNVEFKTYPKLNHLFLEGEGKGSPAEYQKEGHIPEIVIRDIANWVRAR